MTADDAMDISFDLSLLDRATNQAHCHNISCCSPVPADVIPVAMLRYFEQHLKRSIHEVGKSGLSSQPSCWA